MISDRRLLVLAVLLPALAACEHNYPGPAASNFGDANRVTMAAQVVDPDPEYDTLNPPTSAEHAAQAADRYAKGTVKQPKAPSASSGPQ
ncbi:hypothetical protein ACWPMX_14910 [Tsuneonella sp. HG094]